MANIHVYTCSNDTVTGLSCVYKCIHCLISSSLLSLCVCHAILLLYTDVYNVYGTTFGAVIDSLLVRERLQLVCVVSV